MKRWIISLGLAVALAGLASNAQAWHKEHKDNGWHKGWQQDWQPSWNNDWDDDRDDWDDDDRWRDGRGLFPAGAIVRDLRDKGFRDIKEIVLDDDGDIYKVRARNPDGEYVRLFFNAHNGRFLKRVFLN